MTMPKDWEPPSDNSGPYTGKLSTSSQSFRGTMPKGWKAPLKDDTVYFSSESLSAGSEQPPDQSSNNPPPSKRERKRKALKSISRPYNPQSSTKSTGIGIGAAIIISIIIWLILGISTGLIGQFWYWILPIIGIISGISRGYRGRSTGRRRGKY